MLTEPWRRVSVSRVETTRYVANQEAGTVTVAPGVEIWREVKVSGANYKGYDVVVVAENAGFCGPRSADLRRCPRYAA